MHRWQLQEAKARFSELVRTASREGPQAITVRGRDAAVADEWGRFTARVRRPIPAIDGLIAATALRHRLAVVTRNTSDFAETGIEALDPWTD